MANLLPNGKQQFSSAAGPMAGGFVYTYDAGTLNPRTTYADAAATVPNTNPVVLDARGEAVIFWSGTYKVILKDAQGNLIWSVDDIRDISSLLASSGGSALLGFIQSGAGAIARTAQSKMRDVVSVFDFLTVAQIADVQANTALIDVTTGVQTAISSGAKAVYFPAGTYLVKDATNTLNTPVLTGVSNQTLYGDGAASVLKLGPHTTQGHRLLTLNGVSNVTVRDLKIDGNKAQQTAPGDEQSHCTFIYDGTNITIRNTVLVNAQGDGTYAGGATGSSNVLLEGNVYDANVRQAVSLVKGEQFRIVGNDIAGTTGSNPGAGIDIEANLAGDNLREITITGNTIRNNYWGVYLNGTGPARQVVIEGNTFSGNRSADVQCNGTNIAITSNVFYCSGRTNPTPAIEVYSCDHVTITGNMILGNYDANERGGIRISRGATVVSVVGNTIKNTLSSGIAVYPRQVIGTGASRSITVIGNTFENCQVDGSTGAAITLGAADLGAADLLDLVVSGNCVYDSRSGGLEPDLGIVITAATDAMLKTWSILNNTITGPTNQVTAVTGWEIAGSLCTVKAALDFDLTAVAYQDLTVSAPGANISTPVMLGVPNASVTAATMYFAWVSAADTVTVRAFRISGTPNPGNGTFFITYNKVLTH